MIGSEKISERGAALTSRLQSFETDMLAGEENFAALARINRELIAKAEAVASPQRVTLDMDLTEIPVCGQQEQSAYNGHFESTCYHPLLLFNREGDCLAAELRPGNVHSADGLEQLLLPEIERQLRLGKEVVFRADSAFDKPEIYEALERRGVKYAIRIPAHDSLERDIAELLTRPVGRPSRKPVVWYKSLLYQAESWTKARRVAAKVEFHCGELFPRPALLRRVEKRSLTSLQERLVKTGGRPITSARYFWLLLAESHLTRRLFGSRVRRIATLEVPSG